MLRTFNMGIGLIVVTAPEHAREIGAALNATVIGEIVPGTPSVTYL
jgi:phosphoribosylaminoimidazole (AIR) synthetase